MENRDNSSSALWFLLGVAAGAAGAYYLQSEDGKRLRRQVADQANQLGTQVNEYGREVGTRVNEYSRELGNKAQGQVQNLSSTLNSAIEQGKTYVDEVSGSVKQRFNTVADAAGETVDNVESSFQRGMNKAKRNINSKADKIDTIIENGKA